MKKLFLTLIVALSSLTVMGQTAGPADKANPAEKVCDEDRRPVADNVLFIGDSMTGWLSERLHAYGVQNGFEVSTVVWDGSTIKKWGSSPKLPSLVKTYEPDVIFVSLGMNELFEANPSRFGQSVEAIKAAAGDVPMIWVGPPSWPGHDKGEILNGWLAEEMGEGHFFSSFDLALPRQSKTNPHPTRKGMIEWMDAVVDWVQKDGAVRFISADKPAGDQMSRGKIFIYKRMKEKL